MQEQIHKRLASVVSRCLRAVFDAPYQFQIVFERTRGKTAARLTFVKDGHEFEPGYAVGGGVLDVAAFALWVACLMTKRPAPMRVLLADEIAKNLNGVVARDRFCRLLPVLAEELGVQMIFVSDNWLKVGNVIEID